jgi:hypothetical protein
MKGGAPQKETSAPIASTSAPAPPDPYEHTISLELSDDFELVSDTPPPAPEPDAGAGRFRPRWLVVTRALFLFVSYVSIATWRTLVAARPHIHALLARARGALRAEWKRAYSRALTS